MLGSAATTSNESDGFIAEELAPSCCRVDKLHLTSGLFYSCLFAAAVKTTAAAQWVERGSAKRADSESKVTWTLYECQDALFYLR